MKVKLMPTGIGGQRGFSLVELMVVVAIIGILAALAVPRFQKFQAKAKQGEAKSNLSHVYTLEQSYYGDNDTFSCTLTGVGGIGFTVDGHSRYTYTIVGSARGGCTAGGFTGTATGTPPTAIMAGCAADVWTLDDLKALANVHDCTLGT